MRHALRATSHSMARRARAFGRIGSSLALLVVGCSGTVAVEVAGGSGGGASSSAASSSAGGAGGAGGIAASTPSSSVGGSVAGSGPTCPATQKACDGGCVGVGDPMYGCASSSCVPCAAYANATASCGGGACALGPCSPGFADCDGDPTNGCETNIHEDPSNCGGCGHACALPHAMPTCSGGTCEIGSCDPGWTDCDAVVADGCEVDFANDPQNCGVCTNVCPPNVPCMIGGCPIDLTCPKGVTRCPGDPPGVCATMLGTDQDCAFCGDACNVSHAQSICSVAGPAMKCELTACDPGWADCDGIQANGCEVDTRSDVANCGGCGVACGPASVCKMGACSP
jgi:hypothetical protein